MANEIVGKQIVRIESPTTGARVDFGYPALEEAKSWVIALDRAGYEILEIVPTSLPTPNRPTAD
jgi:tryptophan synthase alpha subunit